MLKKLIIFLFVIFLFDLNLFASQNFQIIETWKINGPYQMKGDNSFNLDFLKELGGERLINSEIASTWNSFRSDSNGYVNLSKYEKNEKSTGIFYLYSTLNSDKEKNLALTLGYTGGLKVWVNGRVVYDNRISRKPIPDNDLIAVKINKGANNILVKSEGEGKYFGYYFRLHEPDQNIFINEPGTICPDFRIGCKVKNWGQLQILNCGTKKISSINLNVVGDSLLIPSSQAAYDIYPGETKLIPFFVSTKDSVKNVKLLSFKLKINYEGKEKIISVTPHLRKKDNYFVTTYRSKLDGSIQPYSVLLPKNYNPLKKYALVMLLHGAWVTGWAQNIISYDPKNWAIQVAVHDRGNNRYREIGEVDLNEVMRDVKNHYNINEDEIYLAGHSMGGYGTYFQAVRHPDKWNAISPQAGYTDYFLYANKEEMNSFRKKLFEEWSPLLFAENLLHVPAYIVHGAKDDNVDVKNDREMSARLKELDYNFVYDENPNTGHWWGPRGKDYGIEVVDKPAIWNFLRKFKTKEKFPSKVIYKTNSLRYNKAYWITINELDSIYLIAKITAEIKNQNNLPQRIDVEIENIKEFTFNLNDSLINIYKPVEIFINNNQESRLVFNDVIPDSKNITIRKLKNDNFEIVYNEFNLRNEYTAGKLNQYGKVEEILVEKNDELRKNHNIFGPVVDAFNDPFLFVIGKPDENNNLSEAINFCANSIAKKWEIRSAGNVKIKSDSDISPEDIANYNLVLFGNPESNKIISKINKFLPVRFSSKKIIIGEKEFSSEGTGLIEIYPNPLNHKKYIVVIGGIDEQSFMNVAHISLENIPDYVIFNSKTFSSHNKKYVLAEFFDKNWKLKFKN